MGNVVKLTKFLVFPWWPDDFVARKNSHYDTKALRLFKIFFFAHWASISIEKTTKKIIVRLDINEYRINSLREI